MEVLIFYAEPELLYFDHLAAGQQGTDPLPVSADVPCLCATIARRCTPPHAWQDQDARPGEPCRAEPGPFDSG
jgi:hypothetical protein